MESINDILIAVFALILFIILAYKIYKNTKLMRGTEEKSGSKKAEDFMHDFVDSPELWVKLAKGIEASSPDEDVRMSLMVNAAFQGFEAQCSQADTGILEEVDLLALDEAVHRICAMPGVQKYLADLKPGFSPRLQAIIEKKP